MESENEYVAGELHRVKENSRKSIRRDFALDQIVKNYQDSAAASPPQNQAGKDRTSAAPPATEQREHAAVAPASPTAVAASPRDQELAPFPTMATPPIVEEEEPPAAAATSGWRRIISTVGGYISPLVRKRAAADDAATPPSPKRTRVEETENAPAPTPAPAPAVAPPTTPAPAPVLADEIGQEATPQASTKRKRGEEVETPRSILMPSTRDPRRATSLSTITERSEPFSESTSSMASSLPQSTPVAPYLARRAAQLRAARSGGLTTPTPKLYAWEKQVSTPKPREPNADVRLAKIQRMRELQNELKKLQEDADIQDMEAHSVHRRKRVKIDNLAVIPHNRPGDSASTFRVPDIDSDDEMEVDDSVTERTNVFESIEEEESTEHVQEGVTSFTFPEVGHKSAEYITTEEYKVEAGRLFEQGLQEFLSVA